MKHWTISLKELARRKDGVAYLEFALALPLLMALFMGSVEVTRYIIIAQKVEKSSVTLSDVVAQSETMGVTQLNQLITAIGEVMQPFSFNSNGYVIVTSITKTGINPPTINWQHHGGGTWSHVSQVGTAAGMTATLPNGLTLNDKDTIIIAEVFYNYQPIAVNEVIAGREIYKLAVFKPRLGGLKTLGS
jgi:Flp pilus assembly protein TadG